MKAATKETGMTMAMMSVAASVPENHNNETTSTRVIIMVCTRLSMVLLILSEKSIQCYRISKEDLFQLR